MTVVHVVCGMCAKDPFVDEICVCAGMVYLCPCAVLCLRECVLLCLKHLSALGIDLQEPWQLQGLLRIKTFC